MHLQLPSISSLCSIKDLMVRSKQYTSVSLVTFNTRSDVNIQQREITVSYVAVSLSNGPSKKQAEKQYPRQ